MRPIRSAITTIRYSITFQFMFQSTRPYGTPTIPSYITSNRWRVSIHAPRTGARLSKGDSLAPHEMFQSTRPVRGRDYRKAIALHRMKCFNPRAPCEARPAATNRTSNFLAFQSTRPMRGATDAILFIGLFFIFQSTRPMRGATRSHASISSCADFNPRAPCGARPVSNIFFFVYDISIHAPHAGRDAYDNKVLTLRENFNPRAPCGARQNIEQFLR